MPFGFTNSGICYRILVAAEHTFLARSNLYFGSIYLPLLS